MDTAVTIEIATPPSQEACTEGAARAFGWFQAIEQCCSRFDPASELSRLSATAGSATPVSDLLFRVLEFALAVAKKTGGAFDPTVGRAMALRGFDRNFRTGERSGPDARGDEQVTHRAIALDAAHRTVTVRRPLVLDLGAVAKGFAIDLAAEALAEFSNYAINAGGDLYARGCNPDGAPWRIGIRHPRMVDTVIETLNLSGAAVCTSGDYERTTDSEPGGHHILEPRSGQSANAAASATVIAPTAMVADALATAAFVLGPRRGIALLERNEVDGLIISPTLERFETAGFAGYRA
jgi:thiamine biosynthesis lipoprotein